MRSPSTRPRGPCSVAEARSAHQQRRLQRVSTRLSTPPATGSRMPLYAATLHSCTWHSSPSRRATLTQRLSTSKGTSQCAWKTHAIRARDVGSRGARTLPCSPAAAAGWRGFAALITRRWPRKKRRWEGICGRRDTRTSAGCSACGETSCGLNSSELV